ncbi:MAG TPA: Arm DNA-binding domain-containing protein [Asticcacaulis sp.]|nr:Arm DNA-binding domain-containing protein [Asticcacaulis sp.]
MSLTDSAIKNARPQKKDTKLYDTGGLFLILKPYGSQLWRLKYRFGGIEKTLMLGTYPDIAPKDARRKRDEARKLLADDIDPGAEKKRQKLEAEITAFSGDMTPSRGIGFRLASASFRYGPSPIALRFGDGDAGGLNPWMITDRLDRTETIQLHARPFEDRGKMIVGIRPMMQSTPRFRPKSTYPWQSA